MFKYVVRRLVQALPILIGVSLISFAIVYLAPGGPLDALRGNPKIPRETINRMIENLGLNEPLWIQYLKWIRGMLTFNFGVSFVDGRVVTDKIVELLPNTIILMGAALLVTILIAIPLGVLAATRRYSVFDYGLTTAAYVGIAMPSFWLGLLLMYVFAIRLNWFESIGMYSQGVRTVPNLLWHLVLPVASLSLQSIAAWSRYMRATMVEVVRQDYIRTARAKGLSERVVIYKHAIKNAMIPIVTLIGLSLPSLVGGAAITETIFSWPGLGRLAVGATFQRDYPVVMAFIMISALAVIIGNLLSDVAYAWLDPRIRYD